MDRLVDLQWIDHYNSVLDPESDEWSWNIRSINRHLRRDLLAPDQSPDVHAKAHVTFRDGTDQWVRVDALAHLDPLQVSSYALNHGLEDDPLWSPFISHFVASPARRAHTLRIVQAYKTSIAGTKYKFGVEVPRGVKHALFLDKANNNTRWKDSMGKELMQLSDYKTFRDPTVADDLQEYQFVPYHFVFDIKYDGRRKSRLVACGDRTITPPKEDTYSGVVSIETVRLMFLLAEKQNLRCCAADIGNAFLYGKSREKCYIRAGPEFGPALCGKRLIVDKSLYGLKSSAARFHEHCAAKFRSMGYVPSRADDDLWVKTHDDGHHSYIASYVDDVISWHRDPMSVIQELQKDYILKGVGSPEYYLGGDVVEFRDTEPRFLKDGVSRGLSAYTYITQVVEKFKRDILDLNHGKKQSRTPMKEDYHPENDTTELLGPIKAAQYRSMIGSANWCVTLGRFDIQYATNTLARFNIAPRQGHYDALVRLIGYLECTASAKIVLDHSQRDHSKYDFTISPFWKEYYPDAKEDISEPNPHLQGTDLPPPHGDAIQMTIYVDADHAHDQVTRRSVTGILVFIDNTPIRWISKRQATVETSTYGSEMVAARQAAEIVLEMRHMLRALGIKIDGPALMLGDNLSVIVSTSFPSSQLKKKNLGCCYHRVRECISAGVLHFEHVESVLNFADVLTKPLSRVVFDRLISPLLFRQPTELLRARMKPVPPPCTVNFIPPKRSPAAAAAYAKSTR